MSGDGARPIFVLGVLNRSGTNYLFDLIRCHPDCEAPAPIWEDFLLAHAHHLERYVDAVVGSWDPDWGVEASARSDLERALGGGICAFLEGRRAGRRVVTKTPAVDNLHLFFELFPAARLLVIVRDGRALVESGVRSFDWHRESATRKFDAAAKRILALETTHAGEASSRVRIVRYEDLYADPEGMLRQLLPFLGLDVDTYDFDAARDLPLRGSSTLRAETGGRMHWEPVAKPADFDPTSRFSGWSRARHERFNWIAGASLRALGYEPVTFGGRRGPWWLYNVGLDLAWGVVEPLRGVLGPLRRRVRRRVGRGPRWRSVPRGEAASTKRGAAGQ